MKKFWDTIGSEVVGVIQEFHSKGKLSKSATSSFLALILKCDIPQTLEDYRPICLISGLLKIISIILVVRLRRVIQKLVSRYQTKFIRSRQILDGVLFANKIIGLA